MNTTIIIINIILSIFIMVLNGVTIAYAFKNQHRDIGAEWRFAFGTSLLIMWVAKLLLH